MRSIVAILIGLSFFLVSSHATVAQEGGPVRVIITPFTSKFGSKDRELTGAAEEGFRAELKQGRKYAPVSNEEVMQAAARIGLSRPFEGKSLGLLAHELGVTCTVSGEIGFKKYMKPSSTNPAVVSIGIEVLVHDVKSGDLVNCVAEIGSIAVSAESTPGRLLPVYQEAALKSVMIDIRRLGNNTLPQGRVIDTNTESRERVMVDVGSRDGVMENMQFRVLRDGMPVALVRTTRVYRQQSEAQIVGNTLGVRFGDSVRALMPRIMWDDRIGCEPIPKGWLTVASYWVKAILRRLSPPHSSTLTAETSYAQLYPDF
jgi:hypothetical protein